MGIWSELLQTCFTGRLFLAAFLLPGLNRNPGNFVGALPSGELGVVDEHFFCSVATLNILHPKLKGNGGSGAFCKVALTQ